MDDIAATEVLDAMSTSVTVMAISGAATALFGWLAWGMLTNDAWLFGMVLTLIALSALTAFLKAMTLFLAGLTVGIEALGLFLERRRARREQDSG